MHLIVEHITIKCMSLHTTTYVSESELDCRLEFWNLL